MKITGVHAHVLEAELSEPFAYSRMWYAKRMSMIVEIVTDDGLTGWSARTRSAANFCGMSFTPATAIMGRKAS